MENDNKEVKKQKYGSFFVKKEVSSDALARMKAKEKEMQKIKIANKMKDINSQGK